MIASSNWVMFIGVKLTWIVKNYIFKIFNWESFDFFYFFDNTSPRLIRLNFHFSWI